jgi:hypothetical protein
LLAPGLTPDERADGAVEEVRQLLRVFLGGDSPLAEVPAECEEAIRARALLDTSSWENALQS